MKLFEFIQKIIFRQISKIVTGVVLYSDSFIFIPTWTSAYMHSLSNKNAENHILLYAILVPPTANKPRSIFSEIWDQPS